MSIYDQFAGKPWFHPPGYTSEADPSHAATERGLVRDTDPETGEVTGGRDHYSPTEFGDGRPSGGSRDDSPMVYRGPTPGAVIDVDDKDELDGPPTEYVPQSRVQPKPAGPPTTQELARDMPAPRPAKPDPRQPSHPDLRPRRISLSLAGMGKDEISIEAADLSFVADADELEHYATVFRAWAEILRKLGR